MSWLRRFRADNQQRLSEVRQFSRFWSNSPISVRLARLYDEQTMTSASNYSYVSQLKMFGGARKRGPSACFEVPRQ